MEFIRFDKSEESIELDWINELEDWTDFAIYTSSTFILEKVQLRSRGLFSARSRGLSTARPLFASALNDESSARHGTARHGTARHGTARHGTARHGGE